MQVDERRCTGTPPPPAPARGSAARSLCQGVQRRTAEVVARLRRQRHRSATTDDTLYPCIPGRGRCRDTLFCVGSIRRCTTHCTVNTAAAAAAATTTTTTTVLRPFVWDYPGEPVPEETFTHSHGPLKWGEGRAGGAYPPPPSNTSGAIHVFGPSWKMLNQPPVSPLTLAMTENYEICCHKMSDFKAKMHQIVCRLGLCPRPRIYSVHFVYLYVLCNWHLPPPPATKSFLSPCTP